MESTTGSCVTETVVNMSNTVLVSDKFVILKTHSRLIVRLQAIAKKGLGNSLFKPKHSGVGNE